MDLSERIEGSSEKRQLVYGCTKSPVQGSENGEYELIMLSLQVTGYSDKELPFVGVFCLLEFGFLGVYRVKN